MGRHKNSSRTKWLEEAKKIVIRNGVAAINLDELSEKIGVSKTSFYHFFGSKSRFLDVLFEKGIQDGTDDVIKVVSKEKNPWDKIEKLIHFVFDKNRPNELFFRRLRTYGLHNKNISQLINKTEIRRMQFLTGLLMQAGIDEQEAAEKAQYFYIYTLGIYERFLADPSILQEKEKIYNRLRQILVTDWILITYDKKLD